LLKRKIEKKSSRKGRVHAVSSIKKKKRREAGIALVPVTKG